MAVADEGPNTSLVGGRDPNLSKRCLPILSFELIAPIICSDYYARPNDGVATQLHNSDPGL